MDDTHEGFETPTRPLLPLRMVVEWSYCARLFHYMHVEGLMEANAHVWRGRQSHARTDAPGRSKVRREVVEADPEEPPLVWQSARAVELEAPALGLRAKLDSVLLDDEGTAIPVELKSGSGPDEDAPAVTLCPGVWNSDALHVALQMMMLREAGYTVPRGELWYQAARRRVEVVLTDALQIAALDAVTEAERAQRAGVRPAPLEDSPKCRGCSFAEVCMPDESVLLRQGVAVDDDLDDTREARDPVPPKALARRRLVAAQMEGRTLTVSTPGASVRKEGEALVLAPPPWKTDGAKPQRVALEQIDALCLYGSVQASTAALMACLEHGIPVSLHTGTGRLLGTVSAGLGNNVRLRMRQHAVADDPDASLDLARAFVRGKIRNQRVFLRRHGVLDEDAHNQWASLAGSIDGAPEADDLRGIEGRAAALYFPRLSALLEDRGGPAFRMNNRSRRPPRDPSNAMLSFGYAVLARECAEVVRRVGFDPMRGFLHGVGWGRPALALDLMEEFRVLVVDSTVLRLVAERRVTADDFHQELQGVTMKPGARKALLQGLDQRREEEITHPVFGYKVSYRRAMELQSRVLARVLEGECDRYVALTTR